MAEPLTTEQVLFCDEVDNDSQSDHDSPGKSPSEASDDKSNGEDNQSLRSVYSAALSLVSLHKAKSPQQCQADDVSWFSSAPASSEAKLFNADLASRLKRDMILQEVKSLHDKVERIDARLTNHEVTQQFRIQSNKDKWQQLNALDYGMQGLQQAMQSREWEFKELKKKMDTRMKEGEELKKGIDAKLAKLDMFIAKVHLVEATIQANIVPHVAGTEFVVAQIKEDVQVLKHWRTTIPDLRDVRHCKKKVEEVMAMQELFGADQKNFEANTTLKFEELLKKADDLVSTRITENMESKIREMAEAQDLSKMLNFLGPDLVSTRDQVAIERQGAAQSTCEEPTVPAVTRNQQARKPRGKFGSNKSQGFYQ